MKRAATIGLTMGLVASSLMNAMPAQAADPVTSVFKGVGSIVSGTVDAAGNIIDSSGKVVGRVVEGSVGTAGAVIDTATGTVGTTGKVVDTTAGAATALTFGTVTEVLGMSLDNRRADIDRMIANAVISGKLTSTQAAELRLELDRLARAEADARLSAGAMTFDEAVAIARDLDMLSNRVATLVAVTPLVPLVVVDTATKSPRLVVTTVRRAGTPLSSLGDIVAGTVDASGTIVDASGKVVGRVLTTTTKTAGTTVGDALGATASVADASRRVVVGTGAAADALIGSILGATAYGAHSLADMLGARRVELERIITEGHARGKLTATQHAELRADLDNVSRKEIELRGTDGVVTFEEALILARALDDLNAKVATAVGVSLLPLVVTDSQGTTRLSINTYKIATGSPSSTVVQSTTTTTTAPSTLTITSTPPSTPVVWWAVLDSRRAELERTIAHALAQGVISARQAADLRGDLHRVTKTLWTFKGNAATFTSDQAVTIAGDLDTLANRVVTATKVAAFPRLVADVSGGTRKIVLDDFGNIVEVKSLTPAVYASTLDTRQAEIEAAIAAALASGKLSEAQAAEFRNWLRRIADAQRTAAAGEVTYVKALPLAAELDLLTTRLGSFIAKPLTPLIVGTRFMLTGNQVIVANDVDVRRADIEARINREVLVGRLTAQQSADLRAELDTIVQMEAKLRADGVLTTEELLSLTASLDRVDESLNRNIASSRTRTQSVIIVPASF